MNTGQLKAWLTFLQTQNLFIHHNIEISREWKIENDINVDVNENNFEETTDIFIVESSIVIFNPDCSYAIAPGENRTPKSLIFNDDAEELSFPQIYYGQKRVFTTKKQPSTYKIAKSKIRRFDRRGASNDHLLYV